MIIISVILYIHKIERNSNHIRIVMYAMTYIYYNVRVNVIKVPQLFSTLVQEKLY